MFMLANVLIWPDEKLKQCCRGVATANADIEVSSFTVIEEQGLTHEIDNEGLA
jgi:hypothetical protein